MPTLSRVLASSFLGVTAAAQCAPTLVPEGPLCGVGGVVHAAVAWDPDGPGPLGERLVVGGDFPSAGNGLANNVAVWEPATGSWSALGSGCNGVVLSLAALPNGRLVAGGQFTAAGGVAAGSIAQWDGSAWSPLGSGVTSYPVRALAAAPNGDVIAAGAFATIGGVTVNGVARWNGAAWSSLGGGLPSHSLWSATVMPNGDVVVGGIGPSSGAPGLARWNGSTWTQWGVIAAGPGSGLVLALAAAPNGDLFVGGAFGAIDGVVGNGVVRWNGSSWSSLGSGASGLSIASAVQALRVLPNGEVVAGGRIGLGGGAVVDRVARWNGTSWSALGSEMRAPRHVWPSPIQNLESEVKALAAMTSGAVFAGGNFTLAGGVSAANVARFDGVAWNALSIGNGIDGIEDLAVLPGGELVAVGNFLAAGPLPTGGVARWNGSAWSTLGSGGIGSSGMNVGGIGLAAVTLPNGDLVVGGSFSSIGGVAANNVARWNGTQWAPVGALGSGGVVHALGVAPDRTPYAGGLFSLAAGGSTALARWNGTAWTQVPGLQASEVHAIAFLPDGRLVVGGELGSLFVPVGVLSGTTWTGLGSQADADAAVYALAVLPNGDLVAGGLYGSTLGGRVRQWNGTAWTTLGATNGKIDALHVLPNGELLVGGWFGWSSSVPAAGLLRWNGSSWSGVAGGLGGRWRRASAFATAPSGEVYVGGAFALAGGQVAGGLARLSSPCMATVQAAGAGCDGDTVSSTLPWIGSTWRAEASGLPNAAVTVVVHGFAPTTLPLGAVFTTALPGCTLHVQPDYTQLGLAGNGGFAVQFVLPNSLALVGVVFHHQMVSLALDATLAVTATNALQLTLGSF